MSDSVRPHRWQPTRLPHPWDSTGKNTGVGCHFLLQCMNWKVKVKFLSRVRLLVTSRTAAHQAPPSMGFSRQEYWSGVPSPSPFCGWVVFYFMYVPQLLYPFICWWTSRLLPFLAIVNSAAMNIGGTCVFFSFDFFRVYV